MNLARLGLRLWQPAALVKPHHSSALHLPNTLLTQGLSIFVQKKVYFSVVIVVGLYKPPKPTVTYSASKLKRQKCGSNIGALIIRIGFRGQVY